MYNKKVLSTALKNLNKTNSPIKKKDSLYPMNNDYQFNDNMPMMKEGGSRNFVNSKEHGVDAPAYIQTEVKPSPIHGTGVFAKQPVSKGQVIGVSHIRKTFEKNGEMYQAPFPSKILGGYNHSDGSPNVNVKDNGDHIVMYAIRDIQPGEEITGNYDDNDIEDLEKSKDLKSLNKASEGLITTGLGLINKSAPFIDNFGNIIKKGSSLGIPQLNQVLRNLSQISPQMGVEFPSVYFHGTNSSILPGLLKNSGLANQGDLSKLGITSFAGENLFGSQGINQRALSTVSADNIDEALRYSLFNLQDNPLDGFAKWWGQQRLQYAKDYSPEGILPPPEFYDQLHNSRLDAYSNLSNEEKFLTDNKFPLLFGIHPKYGDNSRFVIPKSDIPGETGIRGNINFDEISNIFVPSSKIGQVQSFLKPYHNFNISEIEPFLENTNWRHKYLLDKYKQYGFKKGGSSPKLPGKKNSKAYSRSLEATNRLFAENPLFAKPKSRKNKIFDPKAKYYKDGGLTKYAPGGASADPPDWLSKKGANLYFNPTYMNNFTGGTSTLEKNMLGSYRTGFSPVVGIEGSLSKSRRADQEKGRGWLYNAYAGLNPNAIKEGNFTPSAGLNFDFENAPQDKNFRPHVQLGADYNPDTGLNVGATSGARFAFTPYGNKRIKPGYATGHLDIYGGIRGGANKDYGLSGGVTYGARVHGKYMPERKSLLGKLMGNGAYFYGDAGIQFDPQKGQIGQKVKDYTYETGALDDFGNPVSPTTVRDQDSGLKFGNTIFANVGIKKNVDSIKRKKEKLTKQIQDVKDKEIEYNRLNPPVENGIRNTTFEYGGMPIELTEDEIQKYVDGGYIVEELPKANEGIITTLTKTAPGLLETLIGTNKVAKSIIPGLANISQLSYLNSVAPETMDLISNLKSQGIISPTLPEGTLVTYPNLLNLATKKGIQDALTFARYTEPSLVEGVSSSGTRTPLSALDLKSYIDYNLLGDPAGMAMYSASHVPGMRYGRRDGLPYLPYETEYVGGRRQGTPESLDALYTFPSFSSQPGHIRQGIMSPTYGSYGTILRYPFDYSGSAMDMFNRFRDFENQTAAQSKIMRSTGGKEGAVPGLIGGFKFSRPLEGFQNSGIDPVFHQSWDGPPEAPIIGHPGQKVLEPLFTQTKPILKEMKAENIDLQKLYNEGKYEELINKLNDKIKSGDFGSPESNIEQINMKDPDSEINAKIDVSKYDRYEGAPIPYQSKYIDPKTGLISLEGDLKKIANDAKQSYFNFMYFGPELDANRSSSNFVRTYYSPLRFKFKEGGLAKFVNGGNNDCPDGYIKDENGNCIPANYDPSVANENTEFLKSMANSPLFVERYARMVGKPLEKVTQEAEDYRKQILQNLETVQMGDSANPPQPYKSGNIEAAAYYINYPNMDKYSKLLNNTQLLINKVPNRGKRLKELRAKYQTMYDEAKKDYDEKLRTGHKLYFDVNQWDQPTDLHERSHASVKGDLQVANPYKFKDLSEMPHIQKVIFETMFPADEQEYYESPDEIKSAKDVVAEIMMRLGLYDPINETFTPEHYKKLMELKTNNSLDPETKGEIHRITTPFTEEETIRMFNDIVQNDYDQDIQYGKYGGQFELGDEVELTKEQVAELEKYGYTLEQI